MITRRQSLRGIGTSLALPFLPSLAWSLDPKRDETKFPTRCAFIYYDMGVIAADYITSKDKPISKTLEPIKDNLENILVLGGLAQNAARANGDGAGDHARSAGCFLTGTKLKKTSGKDIQNGISIDQFIASKIGGYTKLPSVELSMEGGSGSGDCDSGYSCAYSTNISWKSPTTPMAKEINPKNAYVRLFTDNTQTDPKLAAMQMAENKSLLDLINDDAKSLKKSLGSTDLRKLDEYLESVHAIESRIQNITGKKDSEDSQMKYQLNIPNGVPGKFDIHAQLMFDIMALAFQTDTTRVASFMLTNAGSGRTYPEIGISGGHHELSHHGTDQTKKDSITKINMYHLQQFNYFIDKLKSVKEGKGTLLDNCMIVYGSCINDGESHGHFNLPILLAGKGNNTINPGRNIIDCNGNLNELYMAISNRMGVECMSFGDDGKKALSVLT